MLRTALITAAAWLIAGSALADEIHGCVKNRNGKLRIVGVQGACRPDKETPVTWNTEGPQGPAGAQGEQGPEGDPAPEPARFQLVGFTSATFQGNVGILAYSAACQAEFATSRWCTTKEVFETTPIPGALSGAAWVKPLLDGAGFDVSGHSSLSGHLCDAWVSASSTRNGLVVVIDSATSVSPSLFPYSGFFFETCDKALPLPCCAPVAAP